MPKLCDIPNICDDGPAELWRSDETGRLIVHIRIECDTSYVDIDLVNLIGWMRDGPSADAATTAAIADGIDLPRSRARA
jgi:hypothetical protein